MFDENKMMKLYKNDIKMSIFRKTIKEHCEMGMDYYCDGTKISTIK